ncbi:MAG TPA: hypothetical protein ENK85_10025 [Saprospiraceae bacterium]|nr:hypothetical protein [Saprospiraceae bacterium]
MKTNDKYSNWKADFRQMVKKELPKLKMYQKDGDTKHFNEVLGKILLGVKKYIQGHLSRAVGNGQIPHKKYKPEDLMDELYLATYEHIHKMDDSDLVNWLFQKSDELLAKVIKEESFQQEFVKNVDALTKPEWDEMDEKITRDADGDLVMDEELDDISYPKNDYVLADVLVRDNEKDLYEKLNKELTPKEIHRQINITLHHLPVLLQSIYDLAVIYQFTPEEIAQIKQLPVDEVRQHLAQAKKAIRLRFEKKYFIK